MKEIKQITMYKHEKIIILFIVQVHAFVEPFSQKMSFVIGFMNVDAKLK